ncbi:MFS transporter [Deinococcus sp.]|uniref:MFS transporter n=1 Tax=Deinococcus sp. TaxID=47478 RepID=UPI003CC65443
MTLTVPSSASSLHSRLNVLFILNGLTYASWAVQIPAVQGRFHLTTEQLSGLLFALMAGTLLALPLTRWMLATRGARQAGVMSLLLLTLPFALLGLTASLAVAIALTFVFGLGFGGLDFTSNDVTGWLEEQLGQPIMSGLHGRYSLGALVDAAVGTALIGTHVTLAAHLLGVGALVTLAGLMVLSRFPAHLEPADGTIRRPQLFLLLLLIPGFFAAYGEGAVTDWSAVYLTGVFAVGQAQAGLGFVVFSALMVLGRSTGDRLTERFGAARLALWATLAGTTGFALVTWSGSSIGTVFGFTLAGAGLSVLAPLTFSAAWRLQGSAGIALLTAVFYGGYLASPPLTGLVTLHSGLGWAFTVPLLLASLSAGVILGRPLYGSTVKVALPITQV